MQPNEVKHDNKSELRSENMTEEKRDLLIECMFAWLPLTEEE